MTNEQLKLLLQLLLSSLQIELEAASEELKQSPGVLRHKEQVYIGKNSVQVAFLLNKDPSEWEEVDGQVIALDKLFDKLRKIRQQIKVLT